MTENPRPLIYVADPESLKAVVERLEVSPWVSVDTEADSLHHYVEKLCLVQISVLADDFVIDPLAPLDLGLLVTVLKDKPLILHGADFDLRILKKHYDFSPCSIFDTMIAAQLLGYEKQGLADLARHHCHVTLPKGAQKADWSERPLDESLLTYAANDTHYLKEISDRMSQELEALGRRDWHRQVCQKLILTVQTNKEEKADPESSWQIKGSKELRGFSLTVLKELWSWRENEALRKDRPSFKILNSEILVDLARWAGENPSMDIALMPKAVRPLRHEYRDTLNQLIRDARKLPQASWKKSSTGQKPRFWSEESKTKFAQLKMERDRLGKELAMQPSLLATNAMLETITLELPKNAETLQRLGVLLPWQMEVAGPVFLEILRR